MSKSRSKTQQVAALPWRHGEHGIELLLVTTRTTKRWVIPKGWAMKGKVDHEAAAIEAFEEAGVRGAVSTKSLACYRYEKIMRNGIARTLSVRVYPLEVRDVLDDWPERHQRQRQWATATQAQSMVGEPELLPVIARFANSRGRFWSRFKAWLLKPFN